MNYQWLIKSNDSFQKKNDGLEMLGVDIEQTAKEFGTPLYIYNLERIRRNYSELHQFFENTLKNTKILPRIYYSMKANAANEVLDALKGIDAYVNACSVGEVKRALARGFPSEKIVFTGTNFGLSGFKIIAESNVLINIDSFSQLDRFSSYVPKPISIRLNPYIQGVGFNKKLSMSDDSRFGIFHDKIFDAFNRARELGFNPIGLHQHVGSNWVSNQNFNSYLKCVDIAINVVKKLEEDGFDIQILNLGGGLGVRSHESYPDFPLETYINEISNRVVSSNIKIKTLAIEPGRFIVADAGILVTTVNMVETKNEVNYIGIDAGFNMYRHKYTYDIDHTMVNLSKIDTPKKSQKYTIVGYLGEASDVFDTNIELPITEEEDIMMLYPSGAYCASEMGDYHLLPTPKELFLDTNEDDDQSLSLFNFCKICPSNCCHVGPVSITEEEYELIVKKTNLSEAITRLKNGTLIINNKFGEPCKFLAQDGFTCTIQNIKPIECKAFPLLIGRNGEINESKVSVNCPANKIISEQFIENAKMELSKIPIKLRAKFYELNKELGHFTEWED